jgi:conserved oligomeric Golgi complex subunit 4
MRLFCKTFYVSITIYDIAQSGIEQLFNQLLRPRLRTLLTDVYRDVSYVLGEDAYATSEYTDVVRKRFIKAWENLIDGYKARLGSLHLG